MRLSSSFYYFTFVSIFNPNDIIYLQNILNLFKKIVFPFKNIAILLDRVRNLLKYRNVPLAGNLCQFLKYLNILIIFLSIIIIIII